jgi:diguanylate cyclase (GGDEF)-like protein
MPNRKNLHSNDERVSGSTNPPKDASSEIAPNAVALARPKAVLWSAPSSLHPTAEGTDVDSETILQPKDLSHLHILRRVAIEAVWGLLEECPVRKLETGEVLLAKNQTNQTMYMIISGRLRIHLESPDTEPVAFVDSGQTVGEISVIDDSPVTAYVVAAASTRLLAINEETFWRLIAASHEFAANLLLLLAQRMRANNYTIVENTRLKNQFERDSRVDALTSLYNRRWLNDNLSRLIQRCQHAGESFSVLMLDVDHFKRYNDECGHAAGDRVLAAVAQLLRVKLRPTDLAARYGGEEFVVVLMSTDLNGARCAAERVRKACEAMHVELEDGRRLPPITISLGAAEMTLGDSPEDLLARADAALYRAKDNGRNRVE